MWVWYCRPPICAHFHPNPQPPPVPQQLGEKYGSPLRGVARLCRGRRPPLGDRTRLVTRHSLVRAKGEVFVLLKIAVLFVFLSTISRQPAGQFTPNFACGCTLVPNVSSPLLVVGGPRRAEKGGNEIFVTMGVNGEFLHFGGF